MTCLKIKAGSLKSRFIERLINYIYFGLLILPRSDYNIPCYFYVVIKNNIAARSCTGAISNECGAMRRTGKPHDIF